MTSAQRKTAWTSLIVALAAPAILWLVSTAASASTKLDTSRFVADSIRRDGEARAERAKHDADHEILQRLDSRVGSMFCGRLPADQRAGCQ